MILADCLFSDSVPFHGNEAVHNSCKGDIVPFLASGRFGIRPLVFRRFLRPARSREAFRSRCRHVTRLSKQRGGGEAPSGDGALNA